MTESEAQTSKPESRAGSLLKQAREAKGMTVADIAAELHLDMAMIEALDADNIDKLPAPIFVRGYIKSYARRVGLDEHEVLSAYQPPVVEEEPQEVPKKGPAVSLSIGPVIGVMAGLFKKLVLVALLVALAWGAYEGFQLWQKRSQKVDDSAEQLSLPNQLPPPAQETGSGQILLPTQPTTPKDPISPSVPAEPELIPEAVPEPEPVIEAPPPVEEKVESVSVVLSYSAESWTEIRDAAGNRPVYGLIQPGTTRSFTAVPPVRFVIGNADAVELEVDGQRFDHSGYNRNNVARFRIDN